MIEETQDSMAEAMSFLTTFLLVFAGIGVVVACFGVERFDDHGLARPDVHGLMQSRACVFQCSCFLLR